MSKKYELEEITNYYEPLENNLELKHSLGDLTSQSLRPRIPDRRK